MWVFTKYGFFSAVCARKGSGKYGQPVDPDRIMIRARLRSHLDALLKRFPDLFGDSEIPKSPAISARMGWHTRNHSTMYGT